MNESILRNLTDREFLNHIELNTDLEKMLAERLADPNADPVELEAALQAASDSDDEANELAEKLEEAEETIAELKTYGRNLHKALMEIAPDHEALSDDSHTLLED